MPRSPLNAVLHQLHAAGERDGAGSTDGELLTRFLSQRDHDALAVIVQRHAPMVWGVCRRVLRNPHDAEDAFQATFLVLVRKATTVIPREMVANWLYGVAHQTAVRQRATAAKRGVREMQLKDMPEPAAAEARVSDLLPLLDQELSRLPEQSRALIVLCDLEGKTRKEAARQLGCPEGTVASRLSRARDMLAKRMARHGLAVSGGSLAAALSQSVASAAVPNSVVSSTIHVATLLAANQAVGVISGSVAALTEGVLKTMLLKKIMATTMVVLALSVAVITGGSLAIGQTEGTGKPMDKPPAATEKPMEKPPAAAEKPLVAKVAARDVVVNTPTVLGKLQGEWELQPKVENEYKQRISFTTGNSGSWQRSEGTLPVTITYYVEGQELLIQHNYEPNGAFNYRLKQLRFEYAISNDKSILTLTAGDKTQTWKRIPKANPKQGDVMAGGEKEAPEKEPFTAWGKEVGGLQAGLGFKVGEKRVYTHGEKVQLVVRVRNVGKEEVTFEYLKQFLIEKPPTVADADGKTVRLSGVTRFGTHTPVKVSLAPGKEIELYEWTPALRPASEKDDEKPNHSTLYGTGKYQIHYGQVLGQSSSGGGFMKLDPVLGKLATGKLELEVKEAPAEKPKVLTPEQAVKIAGDSELTKKFNATKPAVEFKVEIVTKAIQVKASGEKDADWVHGHSPDDVCLGTVVAAEDPLRKTRFVAILTEKAINQFNKAGINDLEKHFKGKTVRVIGLLVPHFRNRGSLREVEIVLDDMSQLEVVPGVGSPGTSPGLPGSPGLKPMNGLLSGPDVQATVLVPDGGTVLLGGLKSIPEPSPVVQVVVVPGGGKVLLGGPVPKAKPLVKQEVLTPEEAIKIASDSKLTKQFNEKKPVDRPRGTGGDNSKVCVEWGAIPTGRCDSVEPRPT